MIATLRQRMLLAVSLTCASSLFLACKKDSEDATAVDNEKPKKPKKPDPDEPKPKKDKAWVPEKAKQKPSCWGRFCATNPKKSDESDASQLLVQCGGSAKVPKDVAYSDRFEETTASLDTVTTEEERKAEPDACCYSYQVSPCGKGRPMRHDNQLVLATEVHRSGWGDLDVTAAAREIRDVDHVRRTALLEHGSIAAFAHLSLELMTVGAPADLVEAAHVAALDEIRHARIFWSMVKELSGEDIGPGPMTIPHQGFDLERMLVSTVIDGCIGETIGALSFFERAEATPPALAGIYRAIAEEESTHAELAFRVVRFLVGNDVERARRARDAALANANDHHGFREVVMPALDALVSSLSHDASLEPGVSLTVPAA